MATAWAVLRGRRPGVYDSRAEADGQTAGFEGACCKSFPTRAEAEAWLAAKQGEQGGPAPAAATALSAGGPALHAEPPANGQAALIMENAPQDVQQLPPFPFFADVYTAAHFTPVVLTTSERTHGTCCMLGIYSLLSLQSTGRAATSASSPRSRTCGAGGPRRGE